MRRKYARWFGLFGLLGLLAFPTKNYGLLGFFGFFGFFALGGKGDERLAHNAHKAGYNAFAVSLLGMGLLTMAYALGTGVALTGLILAAAFTATILTFVISLAVLERGGG